MGNLSFCQGGQSELWQNFKSDQETCDQETCLIQNEFETDAFNVVAAGFIKLTFRSPNKTNVVYQGIGEGINCGKITTDFRFIYGLHETQPYLWSSWK